MKRLLVLLLVCCMVTAVVAVAFAQERPGQGRRGGERGRTQPGTMPEMFTSVAFLEGKIYILKGDVLYKYSAELKEEKKKKLELEQEESTGRFRMRSRFNLRAEGKNLYLVGLNVIHKINTDTLDIAGTLKASDLTAPEGEKEEEDEEKEDSGGGEF